MPIISLGRSLLTERLEGSSDEKAKVRMRSSDDDGAVRLPPASDVQGHGHYTNNTLCIVLGKTSI